MPQKARQQQQQQQQQVRQEPGSSSLAQQVRIHRQSITGSSTSVAAAAAAVAASSTASPAGTGHSDQGKSNDKSQHRGIMKHFTSLLGSISNKGAHALSSKKVSPRTDSMSTSPTSATPSTERRISTAAKLFGSIEEDDGDNGLVSPAETIESGSNLKGSDAGKPVVDLDFDAFLADSLVDI